MLLGVPGLTTRRRGSCLPSGRRVRVCHPWSHRDAFAFAFVLQQGAQAAHPVLHQRRHWMCAGEINPGRRIDVPA